MCQFLQRWSEVAYDIGSNAIKIASRAFRVLEPAFGAGDVLAIVADQSDNSDDLRQCGENQMRSRLAFL